MISGGLAFFVAAPLLASEGAGEGTLPIDVTPLADLKRRRLVLYDNLRDLEFEFKAGKIAPQDYDALRTDYTAEAAELMVASQEGERAGADQDLIEREVAERRARRRQVQAEQYVCPQCGFENPLPLKFCGECGARLSPKGRK